MSVALCEAVVLYPVLYRDATVARASLHRTQAIGKMMQKSCTACTGANIFGTAAIVLLDGQCAVQGGQLHTMDIHAEQVARQLTRNRNETPIPRVSNRDHATIIEPRGDVK